MSAQILVDRATAFLRTKFTKQELQTLEIYGGQFNAEEVKAVSFACPAVFVAVRGFRPMPQSRQLTGHNVRAVEMSAFVVTKMANRTQRMTAAMVLAERVCLALNDWQPDDDGPGSEALDVAPLEEDAEAENLYNRAVDIAGLALWVVHWTQCIRIRNTGQLWDLLRVQADSLARAQEPAPAVTQPTAPLDVAAGVQFAEVPFNNTP